MSLLGPIPLSLFAIVAAAAGVLAIGAYIIKMRRRRFEVPFSQLWRRVLDQKDANALWKQLKRLISLLVILLILALVLFAALDPTLGAVDRKARSMVVLIDASASMKTTDGNADGTKTRMDAARDRAKKLIDSMGGGDVAMVMKVDGQATPMSRFSSDAPVLDKIVDGITASDTPADLPRALGAAADALRDRPNPLVVIVSDGAFPQQQLGLVRWDAPKPGATKDLASIDMSNIDVRFLGVGEKSDNVGIIAFNVRRYIANKAAYEVYIEIQNFSQDTVHRKVTLFNGEVPVETRTVDIGPGQRVHEIYAKLPAAGDSRLKAVVAPLAGQTVNDPFPLDDEAYALLPPHKKQKVLMVTQDNLFLENAVHADEDDVIDTKVSPDEYAKDPAQAEKYDAVIFDDYTPDALPPPPVSLIFFHPTGEHSPIAIRGSINTPHITEIDAHHPVMRWVELSDVFMDKSNVFTLDAKKGESSLAYVVGDSIIAAKREGRRKIVAFGFSLPADGRDSATDLPLRVAFPMMLINSLDWFAGDIADLLTTYATGQRQRISLDGINDASEAEIKAPDGTITSTPVIDGLASFYGNKVGYYDVSVKRKGQVVAHSELAANLASASESDITPSKTLTLGGKKLEEPESFSITHSQKLWIYLILLAMGLIIVEWVTYHRRITV